jgi:hypothetical protein
VLLSRVEVRRGKGEEEEMLGVDGQRGGKGKG